MIQKVDTAWNISSDIDRIIEEEAAWYFSGSRSLEDTVDIIESKIKTCVDER